MSQTNPQEAYRDFSAPSGRETESLFTRLTTSPIDPSLSGLAGLSGKNSNSIPSHRVWQAQERAERLALQRHRKMEDQVAQLFKLLAADIKTLADARVEDSKAIRECAAKRERKRVEELELRVRKLEEAQRERESQREGGARTQKRTELGELGTLWGKSTALLGRAKKAVVDKAKAAGKIANRALVNEAATSLCKTFKLTSFDAVLHQPASDQIGRRLGDWAMAAVCLVYCAAAMYVLFVSGTSHTAVKCPKTICDWAPDTLEATVEQLSPARTGTKLPQAKDFGSLAVAALCALYYCFVSAQRDPLKSLTAQRQTQSASSRTVGNTPRSAESPTTVASPPASRRVAPSSNPEMAIAHPPNSRTRHESLGMTFPQQHRDQQQQQQASTSRTAMSPIVEEEELPRVRSVSATSRQPFERRESREYDYSLRKRAFTLPTRAWS